MTCTHVLGLIDLGPLADYPAAHLEAAWEHARTCPTCGPALEGATTLSARLLAIPEPASPPNLTVSVMARLEELDRTRGVVPGSSMMPAPERASGASLWPAWSSAFGATAATFAILLWSSPLGPGVASGRRGVAASAVSLPATTTGTMMLLGGLLVYAFGLFTSLREPKAKD